MPELSPGPHRLKLGGSLRHCGPCGIELNNLHGVPAVSRPAKVGPGSSRADACTLRLRQHRFIRKLVTQRKRSLLIG